MYRRKDGRESGYKMGFNKRRMARERAAAQSAHTTVGSAYNLRVPETPAVGEVLRSQAGVRRVGPNPLLRCTLEQFSGARNGPIRITSANSGSDKRRDDPAGD